MIVRGSDRIMTMEGLDTTVKEAFEKGYVPVSLNFDLKTESGQEVTIGRADGQTLFQLSMHKNGTKQYMVVGGDVIVVTVGGPKAIDGSLKGYTVSDIYGNAISIKRKDFVSCSDEMFSITSKFSTIVVINDMHFEVNSR